MKRRHIMLTAVLGPLLAACESSAVDLAQSDADTDSGVPTAWVRWNKRQAAVFEGNYTASDATIVDTGNGLMMIATDLDVGTLRTVLVAATSPDGLSWELANTGDSFRGLVLRGRDGQWDENLEGPELIRANNDYLLFYSGYREVGHPVKGFPAALGLAVSHDGQHFTRESDEPILRPTPGWYDNDAVYSPTIVRDGNGFVMLYAGHAYTHYDRIEHPGVYLLAATSTDGRVWTKRPSPVIAPGSGLAWMRDGAAEPALVKGPDNAYYLFFTGLGGESRRIGVARSATPFGPWDINPRPILTASGGGFDDKVVLAPFVMIGGGKVRIWYHSADRKQRIRIGYAESPWPIYNAAARAPH